MEARERLYMTRERDRVVRQGDPAAASLYAAVGDEIPASAAERFGIVEGRLAGKAAAGGRTRVLAGTSAAAKPRAAKTGKPGGNKARKPANKGGKPGGDKGGEKAPETPAEDPPTDS